MKNGRNGLKKMWALGWSLAKTNFKLRNEGSYLGLLWYILHPLFLFLILMFVFGKNLGTGIESYPIYLLLGLIMYNFFSGATGQATKIIMENAGFIKSIKLSYVSFVLSSILQFIFSHIFEIIVFTVFLLFYNMPLRFLVFYPFIFALFCIFIFGVSMILATLGVYVNDLDNVWSVLLSLVWFSTPIFYAVNFEGFRLHYLIFNPVYYFITIARDVVIYGRMPQNWVILGVIAYSVLFLVIGFIVFNKFKSKIAERL